MANVGEGIEGDVGQLVAHEFARQNASDDRLNANGCRQLKLRELMLVQACDFFLICDDRGLSGDFGTIL